MGKVQVAQEIRTLVSVYRDEVLTDRTRCVRLRGRKCHPEIITTLLGLEVRAGKKRITCPDMTTARYLKLFSELGLATVQIPYDPTQTARILPRLETAFERLNESLDSASTGKNQRLAEKRRAYAKLRRYVEEDCTPGENQKLATSSSMVPRTRDA